MSTNHIPADIRHRGRPGGAAGGGGPGGAPRGGPGDTRAPAPVVTVPPPDLAAHPGAQMIYAQGSGAGIVTGGSVVVAEVRLSPGDVGVVNSWILSGENLDPGIDARWELLVDGAVVEGGSRRMPPQNAAVAALGWGPDEILWRVPPAARIAVRIRVLAGGPADLSTQWSGWSYPATLRDRYAASW